jgi:hypothetical protein
LKPPLGIFRYDPPRLGLDLMAILVSAFASQASEKFTTKTFDDILDGLGRQVRPCAIGVTIFTSSCWGEAVGEGHTVFIMALR